MKKLLLVWLILMNLAAFAEAQQEGAATEKHKKTQELLKNIASTGNRPADFVPEGWEIKGATAQGDLNGDLLADYAFDIAPSAELNEDSECSDAVIILFAESQGKLLRRVGVNNNLSGGDSCARQTVEIKKGVMIARSNYGNNDAADVTFRFRYDGAAKQIMLIGFDWQSYKRDGSENARTVSYNLLTKIKEETIKYLSKNKSNNLLYDKQTTRRTRFERSKIEFEKASYDLNEEGVGIPVRMGT